MHEEMITVTDALDTIDLGKYYVILPSVSYKHTREEFIWHHNAQLVPEDFITVQTTIQNGRRWKQCVKI